MCGRYVLRLPLEQVLEFFGATTQAPSSSFSPRYNIAPSQEVAVIRVNKNGNRVLGLVRWGLIPHWAGEMPRTRPINARAETVAAGGLFKQAFARRRCLVPADGFYEWKKVDAGNKQPMFIHFPGDRPFAFAGVWERWTPPGEVEPVDTCAIITTPPNQLMADIHDRMPAILAPDNYGQWLDPSADPGQAQALLKPYSGDDLEAVAVGRVVNSPGNDLPECVRPVGTGE